jgi:hypothetical protein
MRTLKTDAHRVQKVLEEQVTIKLVMSAPNAPESTSR